MEDEHTKGNRGYSADNLAAPLYVGCKEELKQADCRQQNKGRCVTDEYFVILGFAQSAAGDIVSDDKPQPDKEGTEEVACKPFVFVLCLGHTVNTDISADYIHSHKPDYSVTAAYSEQVGDVGDSSGNTEEDKDYTHQVLVLILCHVLHKYVEEG